MTVIGAVEFEVSLSLKKFNQDINELIAKNNKLAIPISARLALDPNTVEKARKQFEGQFKTSKSLCVPLRFCDESISKAKAQLRREFKDFCIPLKFCKESIEKSQKSLAKSVQKYSISSTTTVIHRQEEGQRKESSKNSQTQKTNAQSTNQKAITDDSLKKVLEKTTLSTKTSFSEKLFSGAVVSFVAPVIQKAGQGVSQQLEMSLGQYIGDFETFFPKFFAELGKMGKTGVEQGAAILQGAWEDSAPTVIQNLLQSITKSFTEKRSTGTPIDAIIKGLKMDIEKYIKKAKESFLPDESTRKTVAASTRQKVDYVQAKKKESGALFLLQELEVIDKERKKYVEKYEGEIKSLRFFLKMAAKLEKASPDELKKLEAELNSLPEIQGNEDLAKTLSAFAKDKEAQTEKAIKYLADLEKSIQDLDESFYGVVDALADAPIPEKIKPTIEKIKGGKDEVQATQNTKSDLLQGVFQKRTKTESLNVALDSYSASLDESFLNDDISMIFQEDQGIKDALTSIAEGVADALASVKDVIQDFSLPDTENIKQAILKTNLDIRTSLSIAHVEVLEFQKKVLAEQLSALAYLAKPIRESGSKEELKKLRSQARQNNPTWFNQSVATISKQTSGVSVEASKMPILKQYDSVEGGVSYLPQTGDIAIQKNLMEALQNPTPENFDDIGKIVSAINLAIIEAVQHNFGDIKTSGDAVSTLNSANQDINVDELLQETVFDITSGVEKTIAEVIESTISKYPNEAKDAARELAIQKFGAAKKIEGTGQSSTTTKGIFLAKAQSSIGTGGIKVIQDKIQDTIKKRQRLIELTAKSYGVDSDVMSKMSAQIDQYTKSVVETYQVLAEQLAGFLPRLNNLTEQEIKDLMPQIEDINALASKNEGIFNIYVEKLNQEYAEKQKRAQIATPEAFNDALAQDDIANVMGIAKKYGSKDFSYDDFFPLLQYGKSQIEDIKKSPADQVGAKVKKLAIGFRKPEASLDELEAMINAMSEAASRFQGIDLKGTYDLTDEEIAALLLYTNVGQFDNVLNSYLREGIDSPVVQSDVTRAEENYKKSETIRQVEGDEVSTYNDMLAKVQPRFTTEEFENNRSDFEKRINVYIGMLEKALKKLNVLQPNDPLYRGIGGWAENFSYKPASEKKETFSAFTSSGTDGYTFSGPVQFVIKPSAKKTSDVTAFAPSVLARSLPDNSAAREALTTPETKYRIVGEIPVSRDDVELSVPTDIQDFDYFDKALTSLKDKKTRDETFRSGVTGEQIDGTIYLLEEIDPINELVSAVDPIVKRYESEAQQMAIKHGKIIETVVEQIEQISSYTEKIDLPVIPQLPNPELIEQPPIPSRLNSGLKSSSATTDYLFKDIAKIFKKSALAQFAGITESVKGVDINRIIEEAISKLGDVDPSLIIKELAEKIGSEGILAGVSDYRKSSLNKPLMDDSEMEYIKLYISDSTKEFNQKIKEIKKEIDSFADSPNLNLEDMNVKLIMVDMAMEDLGNQIEGYADSLEEIAREKYIPIEEINGLKARINNLKNSRKKLEESRQAIAKQQDNLYNLPGNDAKEETRIPLPDFSEIKLPEAMLVPASSQMFGIGAGLAGLGSLMPGGLGIGGGAGLSGLGSLMSGGLGIGGGAGLMGGGLMAGAGALGLGGLAMGGGIFAARKMRPMMESEFPALAKILYADMSQVLEFTKKGLLYPFQKIKGLVSRKSSVPDVEKSIKGADTAILGIVSSIKSFDDLEKLRDSFGLFQVNIDNLITELNLSNIERKGDVEIAKLNLESGLGAKVSDGTATPSDLAAYDVGRSNIEDVEAQVREIEILTNRLNDIKQLTSEILSKESLSDDDKQLLKGFGEEVEAIYLQLDEPLPSSRFLGDVGKIESKGSSLFSKLGISIKNLFKSFVSFQVFGFLQNQLQNISSQTFEVTKRFTVLENTINFLSGGTRAGAEQMRFLRSEINRTSSAIEPALQSYKKLAASTRNTPMEGMITNEVMSGLMQAGTVFGLTGEELEGSILAISQIAGKGVVSLEELRGQLAERIPGAMQIAARSMNMTEQELYKLISTGTLSATDFLTKFGPQLMAETSAGVAGASNTAQAALTRLNNSITEIQVVAGKEFQGPLVLGMNAITSAIQLVTKYAGPFIQILQVAAGVALAYAAPAMWAFVQGLWQIPFASVAASMAVNGLKDTIMTLIVPTAAAFVANVAAIWLVIEALKTLGIVWDVFFSKTDTQTWSESVYKNLQKARQEIKYLWKEIEKSNKNNLPKKQGEKYETEFSYLDKEQRDKLSAMNFLERFSYSFGGESMEDQIKIQDALKQTMKDQRDIKQLQRDRVSGAMKELNNFIDSAITQDNINVIKEYNAQLENLRQKASTTTNPEDQRKIKEQIEQLRKLRDGSTAPLVTGLREVNSAIENRQKRIKDTNSDEKREELRLDLIQLQKLQDKLKDIERQTGAQTTLSELMQVLARIRIEMEMFNRVAQEVADKGLRRIAEIELKGLRTDIFASADAALKRSENALELVRNKINISANAIKELKALLKDPMIEQYTKFYGDKSLEQLRVDLEGVDEKEVERRKTLEALILLREQESGLIALQREQAESVLNLEKERSQAVLNRLERYKAKAQNKGQIEEAGLLTAITRGQLKWEIGSEKADLLKTGISLAVIQRNQKIAEIELQTVKKYFKEKKITAEDFANRRMELELQVAQFIQQVAEQELQLRQQKQQLLLDQLDRATNKIKHQIKLGELAGQINQKTSQIRREIIVDTRTRFGEDTQTEINRQTEDETLAGQRESSVLYKAELQRNLALLQSHYSNREISQRDYEDKSREIEQEIASTNIQLKDYELQEHQRFNQRIVDDRMKSYQRMVEDFERTVKTQENTLQLSAIRQEQIIRQQQLRQIDLISSQKAEQQAAITLNQFQIEQTKKQLKDTLQQIQDVAQLRKKNALTERETEERTIDLTIKAEQLKLDLINKQIEKNRELKDLKILALDDELSRIDLIFQQQEMGYSYGLEKRKQIVESLDQEKTVMEAQVRLQSSLFKGEEQRRQAALDRSRSAEDLLGRLPELQKQAQDNSIDFAKYKGTRYLMDLIRKMAGAGSGSTFLSESDIRDLRTKQFNQSALEEKKLLEMKTRQLEQQQKIQNAQMQLQKVINKLTAENAIMEASISLNKARQAELQAKIALEKANVNGDPREIQNAQQAYELTKQGTQLSQQQLGIAVDKLTVSNQIAGIDQQALASDQNNERFALQEANRKALQDTALRGGELASQGAINVDQIIQVDMSSIKFDLSPITPMVDLTSQINTKLDSLLTAIEGLINKPTAPNVENLTVVSSDPTGDSRQVLADWTRAKNMY
jgi:tape measure domain-containing protein